MIKLQIITKNDKISTIYDESEPTLSENSLLVRELENIKKKLIEKEFEVDSQINYEAEEEYDTEEE